MNNYKTCKECYYFTSEQTALGNKCGNPYKKFRSEWAPYRKPYQRSCASFISADRSEWPYKVEKHGS